jgi:transposase InsO family protein
LIHQSDRGSQYVSIRYSETLLQAGVEPSVGSTGDSCAIQWPRNGLYKTEVVRKTGPWKTIEALEWKTLNWVHWFNQERLLDSIGYIPPAEFEALYERRQQECSAVA